MLSIRTLSKDLLGWPKTSFGENPNKVFLLTQYKSKRLIPTQPQCGKTMGATEGWGQKEMLGQERPLLTIGWGWALLAKQALSSGPVPHLSTVDTLTGLLCGMNQSFTTIQIAFFWYLWGEKNQPSHIAISLFFSKLESSCLWVFFLGCILWPIHLGIFPVSLLRGF